jgi:DNA-binding transcriptional LysR family regulator
MLDRMSLLFRFQAIAKAGSVRKASEALNVTQPALSRSLSQLEKHYGQALLERHARGVRPTAFGRRVLTTVSRLARDWELAEADLASGNPDAEGRLRVHAGPLWSSVVLPSILPSLHATFPNLTIEMSPSAGVSLQALLEGRVDVSFGGLYAPERNYPQLEAFAFGTIRDRVTARSDHPIQRCDPGDYAMVHHYPWIVYAADPIYEAETLHGVMERTGAMPQVRMRTSSLLAIFRLLQEGDYLCILPDGAVNGIPGRPLKPIPIEMGHRNSETGALLRRTMTHYPPMRSLLDLCGAYFARTVEA